MLKCQDPKNDLDAKVNLKSTLTISIWHVMQTSNNFKWRVFIFATLGVNRVYIQVTRKVSDP